jgi:predicted peroxiredoxin
VYVSGVEPLSKLFSMKKFILTMVVVVVAPLLYAQETTTNNKMKFLIHITVGPENPTRAALGFLVAKAATDEGHSVSLFLAGDAVQLLRNEVLDNLAGLGTGKLREHYDAIVKKGGKFYLSGMSSKVRGLAQDDFKDKPAEFALPEVLVRLSVEADRMFVY